MMRLRRPDDRSAAGYTLLDLLFALALLGILSAAAIPQTHASIARARGLGAARYLAARMALARMQAVGRSTIVALRFEEDDRGGGFAVYADGNGNGVRSREIEAGTDPRLEAFTLIGDQFPGVTLKLAPQTPGTSPIQLGGTAILSFTPAGTATAGTIYLLGPDGTQWGVRVLGATARTRVLRFVQETQEWTEIF